MNILNLLERADSAAGPIINAAKKAEQQLGHNAKMALERWLSYNWTTSDLSKDYKNNRSGVFAEIYNAFGPVRERIREVYGDTIPLYRGMKTDSPHSNYDVGTDRLYSWTFDPAVADQYAYPNRRAYAKPAISDAEVAALVDRYNKVGFIQHRGRYYKRTKDDPDFYDIYDKNRQHITDGDNIRAELMDTEHEIAQYSVDRTERGSVAMKRIPVEDVVWIATTSELEAIVIGHAA